MKRIHIVLFVLTLIACSIIHAADLQIGDNIQIVKDIRYISGYPIDLSPVRNWIRHGKTGVRPLSAWKRFDLIQIKADQGGKIICTVKNEDGDADEIVILNFPKKLQGYMNAVNHLKSEIAAMQAEIDDLQPKIRAENAVTAIGTSDPDEQERRKAVNLAAANLVTKRENLAVAQARLGKFIERSGDVAELLLLNTGTMWDNKPLWNYGQQAQ